MYHVPTGFGFSPKASGFYPFDDATALAGESGVGDVAWLIQASASNHKPKGRFFWYAFGIYKPKEPSLWFLWFATEPLRGEWWRKKGNAGRSLRFALGVGVLALEAAPTIQEVGFFSIENLYYLTTCSLVNFTVPLL